MMDRSFDRPFGALGMQTSSRRFILLLAVSVSTFAGGCAAERARSARATTPPSEQAEVFTRPPEAYLSLDEIADEPLLMKSADVSTAPATTQASSTQPASQPTTQRAPIESVTLYAEAVNALRTGRRFTAIQLLEKAIERDPQSFELNYALGRAHAIGRTNDPQSIAALQRAEAINPDHLELQTDLGRQLLASGDEAGAMKHLRLAIQTTDYATNESDAAIADLFLARTLQQRGYDRAALEQYARLLSRVKGRTLSLRNNPQLAFLITDRLYVDIGDLYFRNGQFADALAAFEPAARRDPSDFAIETRIVRTLVGLKRFDDASKRAADAVVRFRASSASLDLLREVHKASGGQGGERAGAADALAKMLEDRPADTAILFALVDLLREDGKWAQAEGHLAAAMERSPADLNLLRRLLDLRLARDDSPGAAQLLIASLASQPDLANSINELWREVISPARPNRLTLAQLQQLPVMPWQAAAKDVAVASVAEDLGRRSVVDQSLRHAVAIAPPFAPAYRARLNAIWHTRGLDEAEKVRQMDELIAAAEPANAVLAQELRGLSLTYRNRAKEAVDAFAQAIAAADRSTSPPLLMSYALALRGAGEPQKFEQLMWKLLSDHPSFELAYSSLYAYYAEANADGQADRVLNTWLTSSPDSAAARLLQSVRHLRAGRTEAAEQVVNKLVDERPDDGEVLQNVYAFYNRVNKVDALVATLERHARAQPGNLVAVGSLIELYRERQRPEADSLALLDAARVALGDRDPDHLYQLAHLYTRVGQTQTSEAVLARVLEIDPTHPPASNDLGYTWTERGENLPRAEVLVRQAVEAEPNNPSFLDSLGWVLYKCGNFAESREHLEKSVTLDGAGVDPVVLDHLGDVLYRLGDKDNARKQWQQAAAKLAESTPPGATETREDLKQLKSALDTKTRQLDAGESVNVSPVLTEARQAKN